MKLFFIIENINGLHFSDGVCCQRLKFQRQQAFLSQERKIVRVLRFVKKNGGK